MSINGQSVDAFSVVMDPEHPEHLTIWSGGYKDNFEKEIWQFRINLNATNDVVQQMQEKMKKMEKQMENYATRSY